MSDWRQDAECRDIPTDLFYPDAHDKDPYFVKQRWCRRCRVLGECLTDTLDHEARNPGGRHGIYGGMTPAERALLGGRQTELIPDPRTTTEVPF